MRLHKLLNGLANATSGLALELGLAPVRSGPDRGSGPVSVGGPRPDP
jgi:hypothetical protein